MASSAVAGSNPELALSFNGLNHRDQRLANGGNQFSLEPPDQALCVGNGYMVEAVNSVLRVCNAATGAALTGVQDLNTFFGYPAAIDRDDGRVGPDVIDPVCHYDPDNSRFIVVITTLHVDADGNFTGKNTIDVAVSNTGDPTGLVDDLLTCRRRTTAPTARPNHGCTLDGIDARARASRTTRTSAPTGTASTSRPTSTTCSGRASTRRRSSPSRRRSWPPTRPRST